MPNFFNLPLFRPVCSATLLCVCLMAQSFAVAQEPPRVVARLGEIEVTTLDVKADLEQLSPQQREQVLAQPDGIRRVAGSLLYWKKLAVEAETSGVLDDPLLATRVQLTRERALAELYLLREDEREYPAERLEKLARAEYNANRDRFSQPEQIQARHILVSKQREADEVKQRLEQIQAALSAGRPFNEVAQQFSDDGSAARGGDLGYFGRGRMVPPFEQAAFALQEKGEVSSVVESQFGWHLIQLEDRKPAGVRSFEEVKPSLIMELRAEFMRELRQNRAAEMQEDPALVVDEEVIKTLMAQPR